MYPGTDSDSCDNYRYPVSNTVSGKVTYEREVCCNNGFCSCGGDCNCGDACFQTGLKERPKGCSAAGAGREDHGPGRGRDVLRAGIGV